MDPLCFCYWLRGALELSGERALTKEEVMTISKHLTLVFTDVAKVLPPVSGAKDMDAADLDALRKEIESMRVTYPSTGIKYC